MYRHRHRTCWITTFSFIVCALTIAVYPSSSCLAQATKSDEKKSAQEATDAKAEATDDAKKLFDGKSLQGWEVTNFGGERPVEVRDGDLVIEAGYPLTGCHWVGDELPKSNYEISLQAKRIVGNDFFCCLTFPIAESHCSLVVGGWGGALVGLSCIDEQDAARNDTKSLRTFTRDRWYKIRVRVEDARIQCWIDDEQVVDQATKDHVFSVRNEVLLSRPVGLCTFETTAAFRDIVVRPIDKEQDR